MRYTSLLLSFAIFNLMFGQTVSLKTTLDSSIKESSGIIKLNDRLITFNDSQGLPQLYEFDGVTGEVTRSVTLSNAKNTDWEDICIDNDYIYIGDFGNNLGSRTDLKIYKISIQDYLTSDTVSADSILFSYPEQIDFSSEPYSTNFDAEALLSYGDSLYIFTKNWGDYKSNIYALPKTSGDYSAHKVGNFNAGVLITGADYNIEKNCVILCGYFFSSDFILEITDFTSPNLSEENITRYNITPPEGTSYQIEGICYVEENKYYLTSEEFQGKSAAFIEVEMLESSLKLWQKIFTLRIFTTLKDSY